MGLLNNISKLISTVKTAVNDFITEQRATDQKNIEVAQTWFCNNAKSAIDSIEKGIEKQIDKYEEKHNLLNLFKDEANKEGIKTPLTLNADEISKYDFLLKNFFEEGVENEDGTVTYNLNKYGAALAGEDGIITEDEIKNINIKGLCNGFVSQLEINAYKAGLDAKWKEEAQPTDLAAFLQNEEDFLPKEKGYILNDEGKAQMDHDKLLLETLYEPVKTEDATGGAAFKLNKYGAALAGEDGKISKEELMALDTNGDGKISAKEITAFKKQIDAQEAEKQNPTSLTTYLDENEEIKSPLVYEDTEEGKAQMAHDKLLLDSLYTKVASEDGKIHYEFNDFAAKLAGEDGKISKEELLKIDKNKDGKVSAKEAKKSKNKSDFEDDKQTFKDAWHATNAYQKLKSIFGKKK